MAQGPTRTDYRHPGIPKAGPVETRSAPAKMTPALRPTMSTLSQQGPKVPLNRAQSTRSPFPANRPAVAIQPVIQRSAGLLGELGLRLPWEITSHIVGNLLTDGERQHASMVSRGARANVRAAENSRNVSRLLTREDREQAQDKFYRAPSVMEGKVWLAKCALRAAFLNRYGMLEVIVSKRNSKTKVSAERIVDNLLASIKNPANRAFALDNLISSLHWWSRVKLIGKKSNRDGLIGALAKLAVSEHEGELKGALGEIQDASFFSGAFGRVAMDQTKEYTDLAPGQYLDTVKSKQVDVVFSGGGFTHYVETKFDVKTAIGKHAPTATKEDVEARERQVREKLALSPTAPIKVPLPAKHPLSGLREISQQLLGYQAAAEHRKTKKVLKIVSIPQSRNWLTLFTATPSTAGLYIQLGWYLRIGNVLISTAGLRAMQAKIFKDTLGTENPSYGARNHPENRPKLATYTERNINVTPLEFLKEIPGAEYWVF